MAYTKSNGKKEYICKTVRKISQQWQRQQHILEYNEPVVAQDPLPDVETMHHLLHYSHIHT